jgi:hypothetical protein
MPEICKEDSASFDAEGCRAIAEVVASEMMGKALLGLQHSVDALLPSAQLDELADCAGSSRAKRSAPTPPSLWSSGRLQQAREALQLSCAQRADGVPAAAKRCRLASPAAALAPVPAAALPCGSYEAERRARSCASSMAAWWKPRAATSACAQPAGRPHPHPSRRRQRLRTAAAEERQPGRVDGGNRFAYYERKPSSAVPAAPPVAFVEIPAAGLPDPGRKDGAKACCTDGKLLGCKVAGEALFNEQWAASLPYFETLCSAGVREGCLAAAVYAHTADRRFRRPWLHLREGRQGHAPPAMWTPRATGRLKAEAAP